MDRGIAVKVSCGRDLVVEYDNTVFLSVKMVERGHRLSQLVVSCRLADNDRFQWIGSGIR